MTSSVARWVSSLDAAISSNSQVPHSRFLQLATIQTSIPEQKPAVRTVVFRGFRRGFHQEILVTTDSHSEKINQITANPNGELCWYFTETREQFRFSGTIGLVFEDSIRGHLLHDYPLSELLEDRKQAWTKMSPVAKEQFFKATKSTTLPPDQHLLPYDNFVLLVFNVNKVDYLQLSEPPRRWLSTFLRVPVEEQKDKGKLSSGHPSFWIERVLS